MHTFTDIQCRQWKIDLNLGTAEDIDNYDFTHVTDVKFSVLNLSDDGLWKTIARPLVIAEIVWVLIRNQADALNVTRKEFLSGLKSPQVKELHVLFLEELSGFFPEAATFFSTLIQKSEKMSQMGREKIDALMTEMSKSLDGMIQTESEGINKAIEDLRKKRVQA